MQTKNAHPGAGSIVVDSFGECLRQSRNLRGILEHARGRGVAGIVVQRLNDGPGRPGALVSVNYCGGHLGRIYFVDGSHAASWANERRNASPRQSWFAGCTVIARNKTETMVCHSHDYCDANEAMAEAYRRQDVYSDTDDECPPDLWGAAWAIAKARGFAA